MAEAEMAFVRTDVIAHDVSFDEYMEKYAEHFTEWVEGMVITLSPVSLKHNDVDGFLFTLLRMYLQRTNSGKILRAPFVMKITPQSPAREPDLHIVLSERADIVKDTMTAGAADVVVEIVSPESENRDMIEKYHEYQAGGVREYWLVNPQRKQVDFYTLTEEGLFQRIELKDGIFQSVILPRFRLDTNIFWDADVLEDDERIRAMVEAMLTKEN